MHANLVTIDENEVEGMRGLHSSFHVIFAGTYKPAAQKGETFRHAKARYLLSFRPNLSMCVCLSVFLTLSFCLSVSVFLTLSVSVPLWPTTLLGVHLMIVEMVGRFASSLNSSLISSLSLSSSRNFCSEKGEGGTGCEGQRTRAGGQAEPCKQLNNAPTST